MQPFDPMIGASRMLSLIGLIGGSLLLNACGAYEFGFPEPVDGEEAEGGTFASVELTAECETATGVGGEIGTEQCLGSEGFMIDSDGSFTVGPAPNGEEVNGDITDQELENVRQAVNRVLQSAGMTGSRCENIAAGPATRDRVTIEESDGDRVIAFDELGVDGQVCFRGNRENAIALQNLLRDLAGIYQPAGFPNEDDETEDTIPEPVSPT